MQLQHCFRRKWKMIKKKIKNKQKIKRHSVFAGNNAIAALLFEKKLLETKFLPLVVVAVVVIANYSLSVPSAVSGLATTQFFTFLHSFDDSRSLLFAV